MEKKKVAAYCRVSSDHDAQELSYETQVSYFTDKIKKNPEWEFAGIYGDKGGSGISIKRRPSFRQMIADCENGGIQIILCKSVSRFARNL